MKDLENIKVNFSSEEEISNSSRDIDIEQSPPPYLDKKYNKALLCINNIIFQHSPVISPDQKSQYNNELNSVHCKFNPSQQYQNQEIDCNQIKENQNEIDMFFTTNINNSNFDLSLQQQCMSNIQNDVSIQQQQQQKQQICQENQNNKNFKINLYPAFKDDQSDIGQHYENINMEQDNFSIKLQPAFNNGANEKFQQEQVYVREEEFEQDMQIQSWYNCNAFEIKLKPAYCQDRVQYNEFIIQQQLQNQSCFSKNGNSFQDQQQQLNELTMETLSLQNQGSTQPNTPDINQNNLSLQFHNNNYKNIAIQELNNNSNQIQKQQQNKINSEIDFTKYLVSEDQNINTNSIQTQIENNKEEDNDQNKMDRMIKKARNNGVYTFWRAFLEYLYTEEFSYRTYIELQQKFTLHSNYIDIKDFLHVIEEKLKPIKKISVDYLSKLFQCKLDFYKQDVDFYKYHNLLLKESFKDWIFSDQPDKYIQNSLKKSKGNGSDPQQKRARQVGWTQALQQLKDGIKNDFLNMSRNQNKNQFQNNLKQIQNYQSQQDQ